MRLKKILAAVSLILCVAILIPIAGVSADSSGKVGEPAVFHANGNGGSQTGSSDTDTDISTGGSDATTDSTADKHNKEVNRVLQHTIETVTGQILDTSGISDGNRFVVIDSMRVPVDIIRQFLAQATYDPSGKYTGINTTDRERREVNLNSAQQDIMNRVINHTIGNPDLEHDGTKASNSNMTEIHMNGIHLPGKWPDMTPQWNTETIRSFREFLLEHGYEIPGYNEETWIDFEKTYDRYQYSTQYINSSSITDTINVQHIIEYCASSVTERTLYREQPIEYPGGGYFHWDIACISADDTNAVGRVTSVRTPTGVLVTQFGSPGVYQIIAKENIAKSFVSTISYDIREYWILADTGQVLYKKISNGKTGTLNSVAGRTADHNTIYYNLQTEYNYGTGDNTDVAGEIIYDTRHTVTADMLEGVFPATGVYNANYYTVRIE